MEVIATPTIGYTNKKTGIFTPLLTRKNKILYEAADIVAGLLAGNMAFRLSHMYFHYQNTAGAGLTVDAPTIERDNGLTSFAEINGVGPNFEDWIRVPIITTPKIFVSPESSEDYEGNALYLTASAAACERTLEGEIVGESQARNYFAASGINGASRIFGIALAAATDPRDASKDKVFSRLSLHSTPYPVLENSNPTVFWSIKIS